KQWIEAWGGIEQGIRELERAFGISVHVDSTINHPKPIEPQPQFSSKPAPLTKEQLYNVRLVLVGPNKIGLVAKIKQLLGVELSRAKHLVDNAPITLVQGVSENESSKIITEIRAIGGHATAIKVTDFNKTEQLYRVKLVSIGANKLRLIKRVYETLAINLAKAKTIVDSAPCTLIEGLNASECYNLIKQIKDAGGDARSERM
ncbi:ribosomal protein L7/L12, partial [uncultured Muribaculum sp.]|uniref:ribosomal protein L7/L12 n=1 Tax=uncultured Muribaculum sp. TaxID=1918613 RepID=UPI00265E80AA